MPAGDRQRIEKAGPVTARLREEFLAAHPDLDPAWRDAILVAPIEVFSPSADRYHGEMTPYDPADYAWSEAEVWGDDDYCRECIVAQPPDHRGNQAHFGWGLEQICHFQCGHQHHDDEVWLAASGQNILRQPAA